MSHVLSFLSAFFLTSAAVKAAAALVLYLRERREADHD